MEKDIGKKWISLVKRVGIAIRLLLTSTCLGATGKVMLFQRLTKKVFRTGQGEPIKPTISKLLTMCS